MRLGLPSTVIHWAFSSKTHTYLISVDGRKRIKIKTMTENITGAYVCSMRIEFNFHHNVQLYRFRTFWYGQSKTIKTVVWTRIDRCVFDDNKNAYLWKRHLCGQDLTLICFILNSYSTKNNQDNYQHFAPLKPHTEVTQTDYTIHEIFCSVDFYASLTNCHVHANCYRKNMV